MRPSRRRVRHLLGQLCLIVSLIGTTSLPGIGPQARADGPQFVAIRGDRFVLNGAPVAVKGSNYYQRDAPWAAMWRRWNGPQVAQEVAAGREGLGINSLRVLVPYGERFGWNDATGAVDPAMLDELRQLVQIAGANGMRVIVTLFDFDDSWPAAGTPQEAAQLRYLAAIVGAFRDDDRVLAWDLHNEPDNYGGWAGGQGAVLDWLGRMLAATRRLDPNHPLTVGMGRYEDFWASAAPGRAPLIDQVDFVALHEYDFDADHFAAHVRDLKGRTGKPILVEEAGWPSGPARESPGYNEELQLAVYRQLVEVAQRERLAGAVQWFLWDLAAGPEVRPFDYTDSMGLFRRDGSRKPAGAVYAAWAVPPLPAATATDLPLTGNPLSLAERPLWFPETGRWVSGEFKEFWLENGDGMTRFGLPLTDPFKQGNLIVQYFERAALISNPDAGNTPGYDQLPRAAQLRREVLFLNLGTVLTAGRDFPPGTPFASEPGRWFFAETGHSLGGDFLAYWLAHGGLTLFGYPISEPFEEVGPDGVTRTVQWFERARLEAHPEAAGTPYAIQLGQIGREELARRGWGP